MNSKTAFRNTFKLLNGERPVYVPFVYGLAAKISQMPLEEIVMDASYYTSSLEEACGLLRYDGIVTGYDATLEAEAFGAEVEWPGDYAAPQLAPDSRPGLREVDPAASPRLPVLLEVTKRIVMSRGKDVAIVGVLTGPVSLASMLTGDQNGAAVTAIPLAGNLLMKLVKSLGDLRVDAVFFREDIPGADYPRRLAAHQAPYAAVYNTLFNLVRHYNAFPAVILKDIPLDYITGLHKMIAPGGIALLGQRLDDNSLASVQELSASLKVAFGLPLPVADPDLLKSQYDIISRFIGGHKPTGLFYVSDGEIPEDTPLDTLHDLAAKINSA
ncbi:MAG: uroporphyrinogen decarboxylase family protein [Chloroflexota bacterium]